MLPEVITAHPRAEPSADLPRFRFDDPRVGLTAARYAVLFLFASQPSKRLTRGAGCEWGGRAGPRMWKRAALTPNASEIDAIMAFMEAGGGVFATGGRDGEGWLLSRIPRVRSMRVNDHHEVDRSERVTPATSPLVGPARAQPAYVSACMPRRVYPKAGAHGRVHPLMQGATQVIDLLPDHGIVGECMTPMSLDTTFRMGSTQHAEWPAAIDGSSGRPSPEVVASAVACGRMGPTGRLRPPRMLPVLVAYDGHRAGCGRVITAASLYPYLNRSIDGSGTGWAGLTVDGVDRAELTLIRAHWQNLADWICPAEQRRKLQVLGVLEALCRPPLNRRLLATPLARMSASALAEAGADVLHTLKSRCRPYQLEDWLAELIGPGESEGPSDSGERLIDAIEGLAGEHRRHAAVGAAVVGIIGHIRVLGLPDCPLVLAERARSAAGYGVWLARDATRRALSAQLSSMTSTATGADSPGQYPVADEVAAKRARASRATVPARPRACP